MANTNNRNRKNDAVKMVAIIATLRKTQEKANELSQRTRSYNEFLTGATAALLVAPAHESTDFVTVSNTRYQYNESGIYSMLQRLDSLRAKMNSSEEAAAKLPGIVDDFLGTVATTLGTDLNANDIAPFMHILNPDGNNSNNTSAPPKHEPEVDDNGKPLTPWDGCDCTQCPDKGNKEVCVACCDYVDPETDLTEPATDAAANDKAEVNQFMNELNRQLENKKNLDDDVNSNHDFIEDNDKTDDSVPNATQANVNDIGIRIPNPFLQGQFPTMPPNPFYHPANPIPPAPPVVMPALTPEEMAKVGDMTETGDIASDNEINVDIGDPQIAIADENSIAVTNGNVNINLTFHGDVNINED